MICKGRSDDQVKINGNRLELSTVDAQICELINSEALVKVSKTKVNRFIEFMCIVRICVFVLCVVILQPPTAFYSLLQHELTHLLSPLSPLSPLQQPIHVSPLQITYLRSTSSPTCACRT